jgi:hypothetical protein
MESVYPVQKWNLEMVVRGRGEGPEMVVSNRRGAIEMVVSGVEGGN